MLLEGLRVARDVVLDVLRGQDLDDAIDRLGLHRLEVLRDDVGDLLSHDVAVEAQGSQDLALLEGLVDRLVEVPREDRDRVRTTGLVDRGNGSRARVGEARPDGVVAATGRVSGNTVQLRV